MEFQFFFFFLENVLLIFLEFVREIFICFLDDELAVEQLLAMSGSDEKISFWFDQLTQRSHNSHSTKSQSTSN